MLQCDNDTEIHTATGCCRKDDPYCAVQPQQCHKTAGNPIDVLTGAKVQRVVDYATEGPHALSFERYYRSYITVTTSDVDDDDGPRVRTDRSMFGRAWRSNFDTAVGFANQLVEFASPANNDRVSLVTPQGEEIGFIYSSSLAVWQPAYFDHTATSGGSWKAPRSDIDVTLTVVNSGGVQEVKAEFKNDRAYVYDFNGALKEIRWPDGYKQTLNGTSSVSDSHGRTLSFAFNADGLLASLTTPEGKLYRYSYLSRVAMPAGWTRPEAAHAEKVIEKVYYPDATPADPLDDPFVTYHYEDAGHPYALTGITDERAIRYATYGYDAQGRAISSTHANGADNTTIAYDDANNRRTVVNPLTKQTVYNFVNFKGNRQLTSVQGLASASCAASNTSYGYDANGFKSQETDAEGRITQFGNNTRGLPTSITEGAGTPEARTTSLAWHATLNRPTQIVAPRLTSTMTYATGRLAQLTQTDTTTHTVPYSTNGQTRTWAYAYSATGQLLSVDGPLAGTGDTVSYAYDAMGSVATVTDEVGHVTQVVSKNASGQPLTVRDANGVDTALAYDARNRLKTVTVAPGAGQAVTTLAYDASGDITRITEPDGTYLDYTYDAARRVTLIKNTVDHKIRLTYDAQGNETGRTFESAGGAVVYSLTRAYDELGRLLRNIGAAGQTTHFAYDRTDLLKTVTDPRSHVYGFAYDALSRLIRETDEEGAQVNTTLDSQDQVAGLSDPRSLVTTYVRNGFGEAIQEASPDSGATVFVRNARGDVTAKTDGRGIVTNSAYDAAGRLLSRSTPAAPGEDIAYHYDATASGNMGVGRLTSLDDQSGSTARTYDGRGNVIGETRAIGLETYVLAYGYNGADRLIEIAYPSGRIVTLARNGFGAISGVSMKKMPASPVEMIASGIGYRPMAGLVTGFAYGNGLAFLADYDDDLRLTSLKVRDGAADILRRSHAYGDGMNLTTVNNGLAPADNVSLGYGNANRLAQANGPWGNSSYSYDAVGNRTQEVTLQGGMTTTTVFASPASSNRTSSLTVNGTTTRSFSYDGAGNLVSGLPYGASYALVYNKRNRLSRLNLNGSALVTYLYNGFEQMVKRTASAPLSPVGATHYLYDLQGHLIAETDGATGTILREYIWLEDMPLAVVDGVQSATPTTYFVHVDHLMRPILMTDASKAQAWSAVWTPWGTPHSITGSATLNLRFPGQYYLIESGLAYNWHRHYDPTTGRYTQPDPLGMPDGPAR